jgi:hypothetical protein
MIISPLCNCGHPLWAAQSIARGYCERCRIDKGEISPKFNYPNAPRKETA